MKKKGVTILLIGLFATLLWVFVTLSRSYSYKIESRVNISEIAEGYDVSVIDSKLVELKLKGQGFQLVRFLFGSPPMFEISGRSESPEQKIAVGDYLEENSWIGPELQVDEFFPEEINFKIEKIKSKTIKIIPDLQINFKDGCGLVSDIILSPDTVGIIGPASLVDSVVEISTVPIELNSVQGRVTERLTLKAIEGLSYKQKFTQVRFEAQQIVDRIFNGIPVATTNVPRGRELQLFPGRVDVVLRGGIDILGKLTNENLKAFIDYEQAIADTSGTLLPTVEVPEHTSFIRFIPERLEYIIKRF